MKRKSGTICIYASGHPFKIETAVFNISTMTSNGKGLYQAILEAIRGIGATPRCAESAEALRAAMYEGIENAAGEVINDDGLKYSKKEVFTDSGLKIARGVLGNPKLYLDMFVAYGKFVIPTHFMSRALGVNIVVADHYRGGEGHETVFGKDFAQTIRLKRNNENRFEACL